MTDDDISKAICSLNEEQKLELVGEAVRENGVLRLRYIRSPARRCALARRGLLVDRMFSEELTPLGARVREHLLRERGA